MAAPQIITDPSQQPCPTVQECDMCERTTEDGCVRNLRVELIGANNMSLETVPLLKYFFCSEACAKAAGVCLMDEINTGEEEDVLPLLKTRYRGQVRRVFCGYTSVKRSAE